MFTFYVLTDFSAAATNALHYALVVGRHVGGQIRLLHVLPEAAGFDAPYFGGLREVRPLAEAERLLRELTATIQPYLPCTAALIMEQPVKKLAALLEAGMGSVVVVGNANPVKSMRYAGTSTALHLVRNLAYPLLIVPATYRAGLVPRRIVLDTDRRAVRLPPAAETISSLLAQLAASRQPLTLSAVPGAVDDLLTRVIPSVVGLHVYTGEASPEMEDVAFRIRQMGLLQHVAHTVTSARHPSIEEGIRHAADRYQADLLTFVTRQRMFAGRQFLHSVTAGLLAHSRIPVLTVPEA
jgi:nucleotide-binding universal stress UspA family protein